RMALPALEFLERTDPRVGVVEPGHEAERDLAVRLVVEEPSAPRIALGERPALGVDHLSRLVSGGVNVPQFLDSQAVDLGLAVGIEPETGLEPFGQVPARALREQRVPGMELDAGLV